MRQHPLPLASATTAPTAEIRKVYNQVGETYHHDRLKLRTQRYVTKFLHMLSPQSYVLDLGCGAGIPVDDVLLQKGHLVTGLDISPQQVFLAKKNCPTGEFMVRDVLTLKPEEFAADGIVCLYTLFHLPRTQHGPWLKTIATYLKPGSPLLITMGEKDFEGWHDFYGHQMWSSQFGPDTNRQLLAEAGFEIEIDEIDRSNFEAHQIVLATKK